MVPSHVLAADRLDITAEAEPFLLSAILTIASKDRSELEHVHRQCWQYMQQLILSAVLGVSKFSTLGTVEGLLLLAEWVPHVHMQSLSKPGIASDFGEACEDNAAWSLLGIAIRQGYALHLDRTSFRSEDREDTNQMTDRKRLAWICTARISVAITWLLTLSKSPILQTDRYRSEWGRDFGVVCGTSSFTAI